MKRVIFGARKNALMAYAFFDEKVDAFVVSVCENNPRWIMDKPVVNIDRYVDDDQNIEIIIGVSKERFEEVKELLNIKGFNNIVLWEAPKDFSYTHFTHISKETYLKIWFYYSTGQMIDWNKITGFNEKIQWIKLYDIDDKKRICSDKLRVRDYVSNLIGEKYLISLIGKWKKFEDIDFESMPESFVLKCNHGSGWNIIVKNRSDFNKDYAANHIRNWMSMDYSEQPGLELQYKDIDRMIIAEELLSDGNTDDIVDYKFHVFGGKVKIIQTDIDRSKNHIRNMYTRDWEYIPVRICYPTDPDRIILKPKCLNDMINIAEKLGAKFRYVRVDLYLVNDRIYFGELTFTHGNGTEQFMPASYNETMGKWINLEDANE